MVRAVPNGVVSENLSLNAPKQVALRPMPRPDHIPLAPAQERMWHDGDADASGDWNVVRAYRIRDIALDISALTAAIADVVARHAPLRTTYPMTAHGTAQVVTSACAAKPDVRVAAAEESAVVPAIAEFARRSFDLARELPLRARVWVLGPHDTVLALSVHHISLDGHSAGVLIRDLLTAYTARATGSVPDWPPLPVDYIDYSLWKHALLGDFDDPFSLATCQLRYWYSTLTFRPNPLEFPYDRAIPEDRDATGATVPVSFDASVHRGLLARAAEHESTLFVILQTAFAVCVGAFGDSHDVTVATAVSGRDNPLLDDLIGNLADDVLMRVRLRPHPDIDDLIRQVHAVAMAAFAHPDTPNGRLKRCLPEDPAHPLFQATLIVQRGETARDETGDAPRITEIPTGVARAKHELEFSLTDLRDPAGAAAGIAGPFLYPTALFDRDTAESFTAAFEAVVEALAGGYRGPHHALVPRELRRRWDFHRRR